MQPFKKEDGHNCSSYHFLKLVSFNYLPGHRSSTQLCGCPQRYDIPSHHRENFAETCVKVLSRFVGSAPAG